MNIERLRRLIAAISDAPDEQFDISWVFSSNGVMVRTLSFGEVAGLEQPQQVRDCGTAACVAGWCGLVASGDEISDIGRMIYTAHRFSIQDRPLPWTTLAAMYWLGITPRASTELFTPGNYSEQPSLYPRVRALRVLEHMARVYVATGEEAVRWDLFDQNGDVVVT